MHYNMFKLKSILLALTSWIATIGCTSVAAPSVITPVVFRGQHAVDALPSGHLLVEAEEFQPTSKGWRPQPWGENYYAATFANSFLSRKAFLGADEQAEGTATIRVRVPKAGRYLVLVRYEAAYRFETQFRVKVEQNGKAALDRLEIQELETQNTALVSQLDGTINFYMAQNCVEVEKEPLESHLLRPTLTITSGDINNNGIVNIIDIVIIVEYIIKVTRYSHSYS